MPEADTDSQQSTEEEKRETIELIVKYLNVGLRVNYSVLEKTNILALAYLFNAVHSILCTYNSPIRSSPDSIRSPKWILRSFRSEVTARTRTNASTIQPIKTVNFINR